ncbi:Enterobactin outer-membrane receptor [Kingella potus]|uniref:Enterobactin outer-membrane receptor n=1 Tax=Kingella potus TaxID=265175 RepID=A0A377QX71_9NEIS|nr:TonB-dependent receptor plug domain-containing protein [Kingella potus]UOP01698.1 TonB-dependent receptor plug domain-containing protein [Kingella potus]STQ99996.1 Enterobactin outer-membrane receptor [Kingella potus]
MKPNLFRPTVLAALLASGSVFADTTAEAAEASAAAAAEASESGSLQTVHVTAERQAKQQLGVSVITGQDLQRPPVANDISEIVSKMPGVNLSTNSPGGERGNKRQIDIRSMGPDNTLILIDGKPANSRNSERYGRSGVRNTRGDSNWVPPEMIEKIEVLRGPAAARYGSGAMGGVVNIRTKGVSQELHGSVGLFYDQPDSGTQQGNTRRANFSLSGPIVQDKLGFRLYGNLNKTNPDQFDINDSAKASKTTLSAGREGLRNRDIAGRLTWNITPDQRLMFDAAYSRQGNIYNGDTQNSNVLVPAVQKVAPMLLGTETAKATPSRTTAFGTGAKSKAISDLTKPSTATCPKACSAAPKAHTTAARALPTAS